MSPHLVVFLWSLRMTSFSILPYDSTIVNGLDTVAKPRPPRIIANSVKVYTAGSCMNERLRRNPPGCRASHWSLETMQPRFRKWIASVLAYALL